MFNEYQENVYDIINLFKELGFEIYILIGESANHIGLLNLINKLKKQINQTKLGEDELTRFCFYYLGHTKSSKINNEDIFYVTTYTDENEEDNVILYQQLLNDIKSIKSNHKLVILESCHSGKLIEIPLSKFETPSVENEKENVLIIMASSNEEIYSKGEFAELIVDSFKWLKRDDYIRTANDLPIPLKIKAIEKKATYKNLNDRTNIKFAISPVFSVDGKGIFYFLGNKDDSDKPIVINTNLKVQRQNFNLKYFKDKNFDFSYD